MVTLIKIYKANLRTKKIIRDRERHYVIIKVPVLKEDVIVFNVYAPNRTSIKIHEAKTGKIQGHIDKSTIIVGDLSNLVGD